MLEVVVLEALGEELSALEPNQVGRLVAAWLVGHQDNLKSISEKC